MGDLLGGGSPDTSGMDAQIAENNRLKAQAQDQQRKLAEEDAAARRARMSGGSRSLLSSSRLNPEGGVETLGTTDTLA